MRLTTADRTPKNRKLLQHVIDELENIREAIETAKANASNALSDYADVEYQLTEARNIVDGVINGLVEPDDLLVALARANRRDERRGHE